jgi:hypothetical protein
VDERAGLSRNLIRASMVTVLLSVLACGVGDDVRDTSSGATGGGAGGQPRMREAKSLCERVSRITVQSGRFKIDEGRASERNGDPECRWRRPSGDVAVTARLRPPMSRDEFADAFGKDATAVVPDLGAAAYWSEDLDEGELAVLADEGVFEIVVIKFTDDDANVRDLATEVVAALIENTEVPDTTTTTRPPEETTGLCARFSFDTAERVTKKALESPIPAPGAAVPGRSCVFRELSRDVLIDIRLHDAERYDLAPLYDAEETDVLEVPARFDMKLQVIEVDSPEGMLAIQILTFDLTPEEFRAGALELAQEFLDSA